MEDKALRVLFTTNIPAPYMMDYLSELGKKCRLTALFEIERAKDREAAWYGNESAGFEAVFLKGIPVGNETGFSLKILRYLSKKKFDRIIIANPTTPTGIVALLYCRWFKIPFVIQSEGGFQGSGKGLKEKFKKYIMEKADFYLTGMSMEKNYFLLYGAEKEDLRPYPFTSLTQKDIDAAQQLVCQDKAGLREKLGMTEKRIIISVGRFSYLQGYGKGYDILMRVAEHLDDNVGVYIIGGEPTKEFLDWKAEKNLEHVHFIPHKSKQELAEYYAAADLFVLLTRGDIWGLVINEAMSYSLPVITTNKCNAGLKLIEDGVNGHIVSLEDEEKIANIIKALIRDDAKCQQFGRLAFQTIRDYTIENMADVIYGELERG